VRTHKYVLKCVSSQRQQLTGSASGDTDKKCTQNLSAKPWSRETTKKLNAIRGDNNKMDLRRMIAYTCMDWFQLDPDRDQWCALVNIVMNDRVNIKAATPGTAEQLQLCEISRNALKAETTRKT
jgi:hypothetical protein